METGTEPVRWGILSTANIARKNWRAIRLSGNGVVRAVASRSLDGSRGFIDGMQAEAPFADAPEALGSYAALVDHPQIEAVYVPLPTALRTEWVIRAAEAGKHVLCEKPCAVSTAELDAMLDACRANGVQFMDGVMFMHNPRLERVRAVLDDAEKVGPVRRISSTFSFLGAERFRDGNIRVRAELEPHGCLGDLGWYCVRYALWAMDWHLPERVVGRILAEGEASGDLPGCPLEFSGELFFAGGASCGFHCSFFANGQQWITVSGEQGAVRIADFVNPNDLCDFAYEVGHQRVPKAGSGLELGSATGPDSQETRMFRCFSEGVRRGRLDDGWPDMARRTQRVIDACLASARSGSAEVRLTEDGR